MSNDNTYTYDLLLQYRQEIAAELDAILSYWMQHTHDTVHGGFVGRIDENNKVIPNMPKGSVLNSRILWAFSSSFLFTKNEHHLYLARTAFNFLQDHFVDKQFGGVYWTVDAKGQPLQTKKQVYALAFAMYGCSAYYKASNNYEALQLAIDLYKTIEAKSFDDSNSGYFEAFSREWKNMDDLRLSEKDANEKKTMNTHLHIAEAYAALYNAWPDDELKQRLQVLLYDVVDHFIDKQTNHLILFCDEKWNRRSADISFGHDIEAAWLLLQAAEATGNLPLVNILTEYATRMAVAARQGLDEDGGMWYEYNEATHHLTKEKHWWVQAEAMVGFFNCWQIDGNEQWLHLSMQVWHYTKQFIKDDVFGEWYWGRDENGNPMPGQDKVGIWKCPYHNTRTCLALIQRIDRILHSTQLNQSL